MILDNLKGLFTKKEKAATYHCPKCQNLCNSTYSYCPVCGFAKDAMGASENIQRDINDLAAIQKEIPIPNIDELSPEPKIPDPSFSDISRDQLHDALNELEKQDFLEDF